MTIGVKTTTAPSSVATREYDTHQPLSVVGWRHWFYCPDGRFGGGGGGNELETFTLPFTIYHYQITITYQGQTGRPQVASGRDELFFIFRSPAERILKNRLIFFSRSVPPTPTIAVNVHHMT